MPTSAGVPVMDCTDTDVDEECGQPPWTLQRQLEPTASAPQREPSSYKESAAFLRTLECRRNDTANSIRETS
jgi:hypothetical protein